MSTFLCRTLVAASVAAAATVMVSPSAMAAVDDERWQVDVGYGVDGLARFDEVRDRPPVVLPDGRAYLLVERLDAESVYLVRFTPTGEVDTTFGDDGFAAVPVGPLAHLTMEAQMTGGGRRLVVAEWTTPSGATQFYRFRLDGTLDTSFGTRGIASIEVKRAMNIRDLAIRPDQSIVATGECSNRQVHYLPCLLSLTADGAPNKNFSEDGFQLWDGMRTRDAFMTSVAVSADGNRIYIGGHDGRFTPSWLIGAFRADGQPDLTFGRDGAVGLHPRCSGRDRSIKSLHVGPTGELVATGSRCARTAFARVTAEGALDPEFGEDGWVTLSDRGTTSATTYDAVTRSVYWMHDGDDGNLHVGAVRPDGSLDPAFGAQRELVIDIEPGSDNFWNVGLSTDAHDRLYASAWYPVGDAVRVGIARAVKTG